MNHGQLISGAWTSRTVAKHKYLLEDFHAYALRWASTSDMYRGDAHLDGDTLHVTPRAIDAYLLDRRNNPRTKTRTGEVHTKWSTVQTILGNLLGAIRDSSLIGKRVQIHDSACMLRKIDRTLEKRMRLEPVLFPYPASFGVMTAAAKFLLSQRTPVAQLAALYLKMWHATASRPGDPLLLAARSVQTHRTHMGRRVWSVTFLEGKGVMIRGPYTVHTVIPDDELLMVTLKICSATLFPPELTDTISSLAISALKTQDARLEKRSVRRGALQELAMTDTEESTLLMFSGHKDAPMLWRYLGWGQKRGRVQRDGAEAAIAAWITPQSRESV